MSKPEYFYLISPAEYGSADRFGFTYQSPTKLAVGQVVQIPLGRRASLGVVVEAADKPDFATKPVSRVLDLPPLPAHLVALGRWLAEYYLASPKSIWQTFLASGLEVKRRQVTKPAVTATAPPVKLSSEQTAAVKSIGAKPTGTWLLEGVTGSGKTQVYIELARQTLAAGRSVIVLVPEIALTPQLVERFTAAFGQQVLLTHSRQTPAQRHLVWLEALNSRTPLVVVGPRSALFLPLANPGLIVIDESHETSYKQEQNPRYHAIVAAAKLAGLAGAKLILGSATPSLTELYWASEGRIGKADLTKRFNQLVPAAARVIDLRDKTNRRRSQFLTEPLIEAVSDTLTAGRQSLLFINRRGSASSQLCSDCGHVMICPHCQLPLTFHADDAKLICHVCNYRATPPAVCPECGGANLRFIGSGTKRVEAEAARLWPTARIARLDRDSATPKYLNEVYRALHKGEIDILIGTQMIAKGLDLPAVDTIGIVSADTMLHLPDFSAAERTFQLLTQVSGRAGRGDRPGQVLIQTYTPEHPAIVAAANGDFKAFVAAELAQRRLLAYPPYVFLLKLTYAAAKPETAERKATELAQQLAAIAGLKLSGPAPAFRAQSAGKFHWQLIARAKSRGPLVQAAALAPSGWTVDLDPINLL